MAYSLAFKVRVLRHARMGVSPNVDVAKLKKIPKQALYRWKKIEQLFGKIALENKKPGAKQLQINVTFEKIILASWNERQRGVHKLWYQRRLSPRR